MFDLDSLDFVVLISLSISSIWFLVNFKATNSTGTIISKYEKPDSYGKVKTLVWYWFLISTQMAIVDIDNCFNWLAVRALLLFLLYSSISASLRTRQALTLSNSLLRDLSFCWILFLSVPSVILLKNDFAWVRRVQVEVNISSIVCEESFLSWVPALFFQLPFLLIWNWLVELDLSLYTYSNVRLFNSCTILFKWSFYKYLHEYITSCIFVYYSSVHWILWSHLILVLLLCI